ncbi:MAG TPA: DUF58 domain-containing protein [Mycobacteriales bacterium]|nr:DUF58 domain-containing protein [Mycobacteriales bacterium]
MRFRRGAGVAVSGPGDRPAGTPGPRPVPSGPERRGAAGNAPPRLDDGSTEAALRKLQLLVTRRLDGLLQGDHLGLLPAAGSEAAESREYRPGDDVRRMDWPVTARTTIPHVRQTVADRELETWICLDLSASLDFGTALCEKRDLAVAAAAAVTHLTVRGGNRTGAVLAWGDGIIRIPARGGRGYAQGMMRRIVATPRAAPGTQTDLAAAIDALNRPPRRRGMAVVISDFLTPDVTGDPGSAPAWERPLRKLGARHDLLAVEIVDPRELELPDVGVLTVTDTETGRVHEVQTGDRRFRQRYADAARVQRETIAAALRRAGAGHLRLRTDSDWLLDIVRFVAAQRRGQTRGTTR